MGDGCLYLGWFSDRGLWVWGFTFVLVFTFSLCVPWLEAGSGTEGWFHTTELASLLLAMWVSVLELVSLLLNVGGHVCPGNGYLHSDQRQGHVQAGSTPSKCVHCHWQWQPLLQWRSALEQYGQEWVPGAGLT